MLTSPNHSDYRTIHTPFCTEVGIIFSMYGQGRLTVFKVTSADLFLMLGVVWHFCVQNIISDDSERAFRYKLISLSESAKVVKPPGTGDSNQKGCV